MINHCKQKSILSEDCQLAFTTWYRYLAYLVYLAPKYILSYDIMFFDIAIRVIHFSISIVEG